MTAEFKPFHLNILQSMKRLLSVAPSDELVYQQFCTLGEILVHSHMSVELLESVVAELKTFHSTEEHQYIGFKDYLRTLLLSMEERVGSVSKPKESVPRFVATQFDEYSFSSSSGLLIQHYSFESKIALTLVTADGRVLLADKRQHFCSVTFSFPSDTQVITSLNGVFFNYDRASGRFYEVFAGKEICHAGRRMTVRIPIGSVVVFKIRHTS